ncbi:MAG: shikimate kinase [Rhodanobacter sp.]
MNPSRNVFIIGATGAGKTSIGRRLGEHYGCPFIDLDHEIEQHAGASVSTIFEVEGESGFRKRESTLLEKCSRRQGIILATGAGAVLASSNREHLAARGFVVWLQITIEHQLERLQRDRSRPLLDDGSSRRLRLQVMADEREPLYRALADLVIANEPGGLDAAAKRCTTMIDAVWLRPDSTRAQQRA